MLGEDATGEHRRSVRRPRTVGVPDKSEEVRPDLEHVPAVRRAGEAEGTLGVDTAVTTKYTKFELPPARSGSVTFVETVDELLTKLRTEKKAI